MITNDARFLKAMRIEITEIPDGASEITRVCGLYEEQHQRAERLNLEVGRLTSEIWLWRVIAVLSMALALFASFKKD